MDPLTVYLIVRLVAPDGSVERTYVTYDPTMTVKRCEIYAQRMRDTLPHPQELRVTAVCQHNDPTEHKGKEVEI